MDNIQGRKIHITGIVQGVGFRPFVFNLAKTLGLKGWVRNTSAGVEIQVDGSENQLTDFIDKLKKDFPPLATIDSFQVDSCVPSQYTIFQIMHSEPIPGAFIPISPDVTVCDDCLKEMMDPDDLRFDYPFINCTNCGPRFTIIKDIPYDRPKTTMAGFTMCDYCVGEYEDPLNRRFHAQPVACPKCGPHIWIEYPEKKQGSESFSNHIPSQDSHDYIQAAREIISEGKILAIKGLGGFHLACDATNSEAVEKLRHRKLRVDKPFALMMSNIDVVKGHCYVDQIESEFLLSRQRPIVLLKRKPDSPISQAVAPNQNSLGVMLPYTPLHYLLIADIHNDHGKQQTSKSLWRTPLVMTSGNLIEEPIAFSNSDARERLSSLADVFLMHNRDIYVRCDDSVVRHKSFPFKSDNKSTPNKPTPYILRRSRGYAPNPIKLPFDTRQVLATGSELKNTFCLTKEKYAFLSHHIGDMENFETISAFKDSISHYQELFRINPEAIACDLHPNYLATRYAITRAKSSDLHLYQIQHHHAHIASCMADNGLAGDRPVIGIAFDGTGYGIDGSIWGGEFLIADYQDFTRFAHLEYSPLPGGDNAIKKPYRIALAQLWQNGIEWEEDLAPVTGSCGDDLSMLRSMLKNEINTPLTSSIGRLFDAVASLAGGRNVINYEAQAAIEFEAAADPEEFGIYPFEIEGLPEKSGPNLPNDVSLKLTTKPLFNEVIKDFRLRTPISKISARFHNGLANITVRICQAAREKYSINEVALSGGVWQNMTLLEKTVRLLEQNGFIVYLHELVPTNDGGLSLGQAVIATHLMISKNSN
jgi:hydrogenase maturation protein HypF